jgi:DNA modification methylase
MSVEIINGDCRNVLAGMSSASVHCVVTSPPYFGLRDYGHAEQIGLEQTPAEFVETMVEVFREVRRVLRDDGTLWLNLGDSYWSGRGASMGVVPKQPGARRGFVRPQDKLPPVAIKAKDLIGIPWRVAFALQADGWFLRQDIIWHKPNPMPESVQDRCTKAHEYIFLLTKSPIYYFDAEAIKEPSEYPDDNRKARQNDTNKSVRTDEVMGLRPGSATYPKRNKRSVWTVATQPFQEAHFATFPPELIEPCIKAGCPIGGMVLDPFGGAGTTGLVADRLQRSAILIELNQDYAAMAENRIFNDAPLFAGDAA